MKIKIVSLICLFFSFSSCNSWLDIELANKVDEGKLFSTEQGFKEALAGVYSEMASTKMYGGTLTYEYVDCYAQYLTGTASGGYDKHIAREYTNASVKSSHAMIWNNLYKCISGVNNIIAWADRNADILGASRDQVLGECIAIRAFCHFDLYRLFSPDVKRDPKVLGIPYNKVFGVSLPPIYTVEEVTQLILNDLLEAEKYLAADDIVNVIPYQIVYKNKDLADKYVARMNLYAVKAMIARLHQARGDNANAIKYAKEVIDSKKFQLLDFNSVNQDEKVTDILFSDEHIFSVRNKNIQEYTHKKFYEDKSESGTTTAPLKYSSTYDIYEGNSDDVRYSKWFNQMDYKKYDINNKDAFFAKVPLIKLSEMYFILAECSYSVDPDLSRDYINTLRSHRIANVNPWSFITRESIIEEMRREYLGEGQLWYALKRNNIPLTDAISGEKIPASNDIYVFPFPDKEIEAGNKK